MSRIILNLKMPKQFNSAEFREERKEYYLIPSKKKLNVPVLGMRLQASERSTANLSVLIPGVA